MTPAEWTAHALARNDRYLREFVEAFDLCPFARRCRESGALARRVLLQEEAESQPVAEEIAGLAAPAFAQVEVALLILPRLRVTPGDFDAFASRLRPASPEFFVVAFHPDAPLDATAPERLVPFLRRSPDPTLQLVRVSVLDRARGGESDTVWMSPKNLDLRSLPPAPPPTLSQRIAEANFETVRRVGAERLRDLLAGMR